MRVQIGVSAGGLATETAFDEAQRFFVQGSLGAARFRFEDFLESYPDHRPAQAYLAWIEFAGARYAETQRKATAAALDLALYASPDAELHYRRALLYRIDGRPNNAIDQLERALRLSPRHTAAQSELESLLARQQETAWPTPDVESTDVKASIIVQRRIYNRAATYSYRKQEVRIGCGDLDDIVLSDAVFPFVARRHCTIFERNRRFFIRRTASLGRVWVGGEEIPVRTDFPLKAGSVVHLCNPASLPPVALRVFGIGDLSDLTWLEISSR